MGAMTEEKVTVSENKRERPASPVKVMVIDPNPNTRHRLKDTVREMDFIESVTDRASPQSILDILAEHPVDVIVIDEEPGGGNVFEIIKVIRSKTVGASVQFVLMSEDPSEETMAKGEAVGVRSYIKKPYDIGGLEDALLVAVAPLAKEDEAITKARAQLRETLDKLRQVSLFTGFSDNELVRLLKICRTRNYRQGQYIFHEGDKGVSLFVLVAGTLEIRKKTGEEEKVLVEMHPGDCFGEMAIITDEPRMAGAMAATACTAIEVNESVINDNEDMISLKLVRQIAILLAKKLRMQSS